MCIYVSHQCLCGQAALGHMSMFLHLNLDGALCSRLALNFKYGHDFCRDTQMTAHAKVTLLGLAPGNTSIILGS